MIYFNNSSTTQMSKSVKKIIKKELNNFFNPSDIFDKGIENKNQICESKKQIAKCLNCKEEEIIFTSCGSEGDSWLIQSLALYSRQKFSLSKNHIITSTIEHKAVLNTCKFLEENMGFKVTYIKPNSEGYVELESIKNAITKDTCLISIMFVNNILGTIQPIKEIGEICHSNNIIFHVDAVQALGNIDIDLNKEYQYVDAMTFSGHKIHGPKIGFVYISDKFLNDNTIKFQSLIHGGGQENGYRAGTENLPYIKALSQAVVDATTNITEKQNKIAKMIYKLYTGIRELNKKYNLNLYFTNESHYYENTPQIKNNLHFCVPDMSADVLVDALGSMGIYVSSGSACNSGNGDPDYVLQEIGIPDKYIYGGIRITINEYNTLRECDLFLNVFEKIIQMFF